MQNEEIIQKTESEWTIVVISFIGVLIHPKPLV